MRAALATALIVAGLCLVVIIFAALSRSASRAKARRKERIELLTEKNLLQDLVRLLENEVVLNEQAGNDVAGFRHILDSHPAQQKELS